MTITVYRSTDTSAPTLNGTVSSLIALLDACLVNGYGSKAAAGWTKPYTGTNKAAFKLGGGSNCYLRVVDDGTTSAAYARGIGYETMSDVDTGTNPFPTTAQVSGGCHLHKSNTADSTARPWMVIATERGFYLFVQAAATVFGATPAATDIQWFFGDAKSYKSGDAYQCAFVAPTTATLNGASNLGTISSNTSFAAAAGHFVCRAYTQSGSSTQFAKGVFRLTIGNAGAVCGTNSLGQYPDPVTGALNESPVLIVEPGTSGAVAVRGQLPGFFEPQHDKPANAYDTFDGTGALAGTTFMLVPVYQSPTLGRGAFQTSGSWY